MTVENHYECLDETRHGGQNYHGGQETPWKSRSIMVFKNCHDGFWPTWRSWWCFWTFMVLFWHSWCVFFFFFGRHQGQETVMTVQLVTVMKTKTAHDVFWPSWCSLTFMTSKNTMTVKKHYEDQKPSWCFFLNRHEGQKTSWMFRTIIKVPNRHGVLTFIMSLDHHDSQKTTVSKKYIATKIPWSKNYHGKGTSSYTPLNDAPLKRKKKKTQPPAALAKMVRLTLHVCYTTPSPSYCAGHSRTAP